jgi:hypothetical protein
MSALEDTKLEEEEEASVASDDENPVDESESVKEVAIKRKSILDRFGEKLKEFLDNA